MCLIAFALNQNPDYPLALAANRDEFFARPTQSLTEWPDHPGLYAGRDLQAGGTWLGVYQPTGRIAALTNVRQIPVPDRQGPSRGQLVLEALLDDRPLTEVVKGIEAKKSRYQGFNLLVADRTEAWCLSNHADGLQPLTSGVYGLSNATLDIPWPKLVEARDKIRGWLGAPTEVKTLAHLLSDPTPAPDSDLPATGLNPTWEKALSAQFIQLPEYGTRACTGLIIDRHGNLQLHEQTFDAKGRPETENTVRLDGFW